MKKITLLVLLLFMLSSVLFGCAEEEIDINQLVTYSRDGIEVKLPMYMRPEKCEGYNMYFSNMASIVSVQTIDEQMLSIAELEPGVTRKEYFERIIEVNELDINKLENYAVDDERGQISFSYIYNSEIEGIQGVTGQIFGTFYYVIIVGEPDNMHYVTMLCDEREWESHIGMFKSWQRDIRTVPLTEK